ncbi:hypothetical protein [Rhodothermus marinus]|uniref:hypothetical protein n=1 Tax=Rhodothermus marinus TaxID=29549 RepID=UPI000AE6DF22|nr:hypothetical protein [Rhodothermus marinus]
MQVRCGLLLLAWRLLVLVGLVWLVEPCGVRAQGLPVRGSVGITNKGISFVPAFSLGKPAIEFSNAIGRRLRFEPELRFALEDGRPWSFIFWWRYDLRSDEKWYLRVGAHPALSFTTRTVGDEELIVARRFLAGEVAVRYRLTPQVLAGVYYLYAHGLEPSVHRHGHFLSVQPGLTFSVHPGWVLGLYPQVYYLRLDERQGFYAATSLTLDLPRMPFSLSVLVNKILHTRITGEDWLWNVRLIYRYRM